MDQLAPDEDDYRDSDHRLPADVRGRHLLQLRAEVRRERQWVRRGPVMAAVVLLTVSGLGWIGWRAASHEQTPSAPQVLAVECIGKSSRTTTSVQPPLDEAAVVALCAEMLSPSTWMNYSGGQTSVCVLDLGGVIVDFTGRLCRR